jgi:hypothetical protein
MQAVLGEVAAEHAAVVDHRAVVIEVDDAGSSRVLPQPPIQRHDALGGPRSEELLRSGSVVMHWQH